MKYLIMLCVLGISGCKQEPIAPPVAIAAPVTAKPHTDADYVREHKCKRDRHMTAEQHVVIVDGEERLTDPIGWEAYMCPSGYWVNIDDGKEQP